MKVFTKIYLIFACTVSQQVQSGIIFDKVGNTLNRIKCEAHSFGNNLFHLDQNNQPCSQRENVNPQDGQSYHMFQLWNPFSSTDQGGSRQQNTNINRYGQYGSQGVDNSNLAEIRPSQGEIFNGYGTTAQQFPNHYTGSTTESFLIKSTSTIVNIGGNGESPSNIFAGVQPQNCSTKEVKYDKNQIGVQNCTQDGRRFLTTVKGNCPAGQVADISGVCRDEY